MFSKLNETENENFCTFYCNVGCALTYNIMHKMQGLFLLQRSVKGDCLTSIRSCSHSDFALGELELDVPEDVRIGTSRGACTIFINHFRLNNI